MPITLDHLRQHAVARSLFTPTTLPRAIARLGFVQADPIRAPARAQDLTLRHRVKGYRAGDLERRYAKLEIEEDFFINYGFLPRDVHALMHPRTPRAVWPQARVVQALAVLDFVRERGVVHPREVDAAFQHGKSRNWFGGNSNASTQLLDGMHYRGLLRIARREGGVRLYAPPLAIGGRGSAERVAGQATVPAADQAASDIGPSPQAAMDRLTDVLLRKYAPLPVSCLGTLVSHLRGGAPQWAADRRKALVRARSRHPQARVDGVDWIWPDGERPESRRHAATDSVRLLAPFDPVVWDRRRFELFWGWAYRFEAYTPAPRRVRGYYALPLLWRDRVIGWANLGWQAGTLTTDIGYVDGRAPRDAAYRRALEDELQRMTDFLQGR